MPAPSEPWLIPQEADLNDYLVGAQANAIKTAALAAGQANTWTNIMTAVVNEIRSGIRSNRENLVSLTPLSVPPDLYRTAMILIRRALCTRLGKATALTDDQKTETEAAEKMMEALRRGDVVTTMPPDPMIPDDQQRGSPAVVVSSQTNIATRQKLSGL